MTRPEYNPGTTEPYADGETIASRIKRAGLPETYDVHWSEGRKAQVVQAVRGKLISLDEARREYLLSRSEFQSWKDQFGGTKADRRTAQTKQLELH